MQSVVGQDMVSISPFRQEEIVREVLMKDLQRSAVVLTDTSQVTPICNLLAREGFDVQLMKPDEFLAESNGRTSCDLVLLDLSCFDARWQDACTRLRIKNEYTPIVVLSDHNSTNDRVKGFDSGADEFIGKPYSASEVTARLRALLRRSGTSAPQHVLKYADLTIDLAARMVYRGQSQINLSRREFALLVFFVHNSEQTLTREQILANVWDAKRHQESNVVDVYVNYLRNKIGQEQSPRLIHTVRGQGYVFQEQSPI